MEGRIGERRKGERGRKGGRGMGMNPSTEEIKGPGKC